VNRRLNRVDASRLRFIPALLATICLLKDGQSVASAKQNAAPPAKAAVDAPDFAKNVRVKFAGADKPLGEIVRQRAADAQLANYRELRKSSDGTVDSQRELARWCRKQRLPEEEQLHWQIVLRRYRGDQEAIKALKLKNYRGMLWTAEDIEKLKRQEKELDEDSKTWLPKLRKLKHSIEHGGEEERAAALRELKSIEDPRAIPFLDEAFGVESGVGIGIVEILSKMPANEASPTLARLAVQSSDQYVRQKAAESLRASPYETYVPVLIGQLAAPIEMSVDVSVTPGRHKWKEVEWNEYTGGLVVGMYDKWRLHSEYQRSDVLFWGLEQRHKSGYMLTENVPDHLRYNYVLSRDSDNPDKPYERTGSIEDKPGTKKPKKGESIADVEKRVKDENAEQVAINEKIHAALNAATGANIPPGQGPHGQFEEVKPKLWWDWWKKQSHTNRYYGAGTKVWTELGLLPIEQIMVGDRVLTRDPKSGDVSFQLVLATGSKPKSAARTIDTGSTTIVASDDQRFSVGGKWVKAVELTSNANLDGLTESHAIKNISEGDATDQFAIVIADAPAYFVGQQGVLVHDATISIGR